MPITNESATPDAFRALLAELDGLLEQHGPTFTDKIIQQLAEARSALAAGLRALATLERLASTAERLDEDLDALLTAERARLDEHRATIEAELAEIKRLVALGGAA